MSIKKGTVVGSKSVNKYEGMEPSTEEKQVTISVENGLKCENNNQDDNQCEGYGIGKVLYKYMHFLINIFHINPSVLDAPNWRISVFDK